MNTKKTSITLGIIILLGLGIWSLVNRNTGSTTVSLNEKDLPQNVGDSVQKDGYTITKEEVTVASTYAGAPLIATPAKPASVDDKMYALVKEKLQAVTEMYKKNGNEQALLDVALYYNMLGRSDAAVAIWNFIYGKNPNMIQPPSNLAQYYMTKQDFKSAEKWFLVAIKNDPKMTQPYLDLTEIYKTQKRIDEAEKMLAAAIQIKPDAYDLRVQLARLYRDAGNIAEARIQYQAGLEYAQKTHNTQIEAAIKAELAELK